MRIYVSKYVGHGFRVGMPINIGGSGYGRAPRQPRRQPRPWLTARPRHLGWLALATFAATIASVAFLPLLVVALGLDVTLIVKLVRWIGAERRARRAYDARAARIAELDRERDATRAAYERAAAVTARREVQVAARVPGSPEQRRAARVAELDAMIAARQAEYQRLTTLNARQADPR